MKKLMWLLGALSVLVLGGVILSPFYSVYQIRNSIAENDAKKLSHYVEFPQLRKNLKDQLNQTLESKFARKSVETESRFSDVTYKFAQRFSNQLVDAYVTPKGLGRFMGVEGGKAPRYPGDKGESQPSGNEKRFKLLKNTRFSFASTRTFILSMPARNDKTIKLVLSRDRFLWKLNNIVLPISNK